MGGKWQKENHVLSFYRVDEEGNIRELVSQKAGKACEKPSFKKSFPPWVDVTRRIITLHHIPKHVICTPVAAVVLCFWSSVCHAEICFSRGEGGSAVLRQGNQSIGMSSHLRQEIENDISEPADFVVIQRDVSDYMNGRRKGLRPPPLLNVLWVGWEAGVAYRRCVFTVQEDAWEKLDTVWEPVVLG